MANNPDLMADLLKLKRESRAVGTDIQIDLLPSFYTIDKIKDQIGELYEIQKRSSRKPRATRRVFHGPDGKIYEEPIPFDPREIPLSSDMGSSSDLSSLNDRVEHIID